MQNLKIYNPFLIPELEWESTWMQIILKSLQLTIKLNTNEEKNLLFQFIKYFYKHTNNIEEERNCCTFLKLFKEKDWLKQYYEEANFLFQEIKIKYFEKSLDIQNKLEQMFLFLNMDLERKIDLIPIFVYNEEVNKEYLKEINYVSFFLFLKYVKRNYAFTKPPVKMKSSSNVDNISAQENKEYFEVEEDVIIKENIKKQNSNFIEDVLTEIEDKYAFLFMDGESPVDLYIEDIPEINNCYLKIMTGKETETEIVKLNQKLLSNLFEERHFLFIFENKNAQERYLQLFFKNLNQFGMKLKLTSTTEDAYVILHLTTLENFKKQEFKTFIYK